MLPRSTRNPSFGHCFLAKRAVKDVPRSMLATTLSMVRSQQYLSESYAQRCTDLYDHGRGLATHHINDRDCQGYLKTGVEEEEQISD